MRLLVLGGTHHVGRAVVETALARGDDVTTLTRGASVGGRSDMTLGLLLVGVVMLGVELGEEAVMGAFPEGPPATDAKDRAQLLAELETPEAKAAAEAQKATTSATSAGSGSGGMSEYAA